MRVLSVTLTLPFPPTNGHSMRNYLYLRALAEEGNEISLLTFGGGDGPQDLRELKSLCRRVEIVPTADSNSPGGRAYGVRLRALASRYPSGVLRFASAGLAAAVKERLARRDVDVVICDGIYQVQNLPNDGAVPMLLNEASVTHEEIGRYLTYESNPLKRLYGWLEYKKVRRWELQACSSLSGVMSCSDRDREILADLCPRARIAVVPNCIDVEHYSPAFEDDGKTVLFVGAMDWLPNRDAVEFFVSEILPGLREMAPGAKFVAAGRNLDPRFARRFEGVPDIRFTGAMPDLRPLLAQAAACVVPLRVGSGTRIKILEAAAMGKAIVSTRLGAEGLEFADGDEIVLADDPILFSQRIAELLRQPSQRKTLGNAARRRVAASYSLPVLRKSLTRALIELTREASPAATAA